MATRYYFISDMHIGGDGELRNCDFKEELLAFLRQLEGEENAELIINGDAFGLWEFTTQEGLAKLEALIRQQPELFEQFEKTGEKVKITLMPGNHDYELACYPEYVARLKEFNLDLAQEVAITREVAGRKIWIEHGQQHDPSNRMPDFGNPYAEPFGYFLTAGIVGTAGSHSEFGRGNWLKDVQAVSPLMETPTWLISNYFYREMGPLLRWVLLPFLLLFTLGIVVLVAALLPVLGVTETNPFLDNPVMNVLGSITGSTLRAILVIDSIIAFVMLLAAIPLGFLLRDVRATLTRYSILRPKEPKGESLTGGSDTPYVRAARAIFARDTSVAVFVYGHTHMASLKEVDGRIVLNTGTWLKRQDKLPVLFGYLHPVYRASFHLNYFAIAEEEGRVTVQYGLIEKEWPDERTFLQRLLTVTRRPKRAPPIPEKTVVCAPDDSRDTEHEPQAENTQSHAKPENRR